MPLPARPKTRREALLLKAKGSKAPRAAKVRRRPEYHQHVAVARWLNSRPGLLWVHCPNGEHRHIATAKKLKEMGVRAGCPDILVFSRSTKHPEAQGVAIEIKSEKGGSVSPQQKLFMAELQRCGWLCFVARGAASAIAYLESLGY